MLMRFLDFIFGYQLNFIMLLHVSKATNFDKKSGEILDDASIDTSFVQIDLYRVNHKFGNVLFS